MTITRHTNNFSTTLATGINNSVTTMTLTSGTGLPTLSGSDQYYLTLDDATNIEIVKVTAAAGSTISTMVRAQNGTTAQSFASGTIVELRLIAGVIDGKQDAVATAGQAIDFGDATSFEIPNNAAPTVAAAGEIALDTTITDHKPLIKYYTGSEEMVVLAMPTSNLLTTDAYIISYDAATDAFKMVAASGGGGNTFSTFAVSGQSNVVADSPTDTITYAAGTAMTLTTNATTDTVTWAVTDNPTLGGTGGMVPPVGTTAQRAGSAGTMRYNSTLSKFDFNEGGTWVNMMRRSEFPDGLTYFAISAANTVAITKGGIMYGTNTGFLGELAFVSTATRYLANTGGGGIPAWAQINLANGVTGILPKSSGGTGAINTQCFSVYRATNQSISAATITLIQYATEVFDTYNAFDSTTNYRFQPLIAGRYNVGAQVSFDSVFTAGTLVTIYIYKNGVPVAETFGYADLANHYIGQFLSVLVDMNGTTDYLDVRCAHFDSVSRNLAGGQILNYFSGNLIEAA